uniref:Uncharacterized protein n=1 Tax=Glossina pallidipes TaxID=7398 RepID=A0A1A9ZVE0_GLOPL
MNSCSDITRVHLFSEWKSYATVAIEAMNKCDFELLLNTLQFSFSSKNSIIKWNVSHIKFPRTIITSYLVFHLSFAWGGFLLCFYDLLSKTSKVSLPNSLYSLSLYIPFYNGAFMLTTRDT